MAIDLVAIFRMQDEGTAQIRRIMRQMDNLGNATRNTTRTIGNQANQLSGLKTQIAGVAGAYVGAQGALKAFNATLGAAAHYEASEVAVKAIFNDEEASSAYLKMVNKMAIDSPLLNSTDMLSNSKGLVAMTKNVDELGKAWSIIERLQVLDPTQGTDGASFALKEMFQGDSLSMVERFGLKKSELNRIKKLDIPSQIREINQLLDGMGITQATVDAMGQTTIGYWNQIGERAETFLRTIGRLGNSKIGDVLGEIVAKFDSMDLDVLAVKIDAVIGNGVQNVVDFIKKIWSLKETIASVAKVVGTFGLSVGGIVLVAKTIMGIGAAFAFIASPIGLIALGITGLIFGFKTLYEKSETFRNAIDGITAKATELYEAFKSGGTSGLIDSLFPPDTAAKVNSFVDGIKTKASELMTAFNEGGVMGVLSSLLPPGVVEEITSFANTIKTQLGEVIPFIKEKFEQMRPTFEMLQNAFKKVQGVVMEVFPAVWSVLEPILSNVWSSIQRVADVATWAFSNIIVPGLALLSAAFSAVWSIIGPILELIGAAIKLSFEVLKIVWDTIIAPFAESLTGIFAKAVELAIPIVEKIGSVFEKIGGLISAAAGKISNFAETLKSVKVPGWIGKIGSGAASFISNIFGGGKKDGSHYNGIGRIGWDGYIAELHAGERVLNRFEADQYDAIMGGEMQVAGVSDFKHESGGISTTTINNTTTNNNGNNATPTQGSTSISIDKLADSIVVREDADITRIADEFVAKILEKRGVTA